MNFIDFCSGIGGFRLGLELAGYKCMGFCEKDKFAVKSYRAMFDTKGEWLAGDVTKLKSEDIPYADIWCFGFPCQDISVAGKMEGIKGERSGLWSEMYRICREIRPKYIIIEKLRHYYCITFFRKSKFFIIMNKFNILCFFEKNYQ